MALRSGTATVDISVLLGATIDSAGRWIQRREDRQTAGEPLEVVDVSPVPGASQVEEHRECKVCLAKPAATAFLPCRHSVVCEECMEVLNCGDSWCCPMCRCEVQVVLRGTFDSDLVDITLAEARERQRSLQEVVSWSWRAALGRQVMRGVRTLVCAEARASETSPRRPLHFITGNEEEVGGAEESRRSEEDDDDASQPPTLPLTHPSSVHTAEELEVSPPKMVIWATPSLSRDRRHCPSSPDGEDFVF